MHLSIAKICRANSEFPFKKSLSENVNISQLRETQQRKLTTGSGASSSLHITHGTPVFNPTAIFAAQFMYARPAAPRALLSGPYSFSIYINEIKTTN